MLAVAHDREVGVDIEAIRRERSTSGIAVRFFAPVEVRALTETPEDRRVSAFFACWSRKEAYIKARGEGLHIALDSFEVSLGEDAELLKAEDRERWSMCALEAPPGYAAALVAEGTGWRVTRFEWHPEI
jgi:4'-phosphopantetheinyl transferase